MVNILNGSIVNSFDDEKNESDSMEGNIFGKIAAEANCDQK
jgi:hypothetical protein